MPRGFPLQDTGPRMNELFHDLAVEQDERKVFAAGRCPTCHSPDPMRHPSMQPDGGEVQLCRDPWHSPIAA